MRLFLTLILSLIGFSMSADNINYIDSLISRGNRAYDLSQRTRIKECADSALMLLSAGGHNVNDSIDRLASIYKLYGNYHYENSEFDVAESYFEKAQNIIDCHPDVSFRSLTRLLLLRDKAQLYYRLENYPLATELMSEVNDELDFNEWYLPNGDQWIISKLTYAICLARVKDFNNAIRIAEDVLSNAIDKESLSYAMAERMYAKILMLADADRSGALNAYKKYFEKQKQEAMKNLAKMDSRQRNEYWQTLRPFITDSYQLEDADAGFLYDITLFAKGLLLQLDRLSGNDAASEQSLKTLSYEWTDIQKRLKPNQAAIEFIQYEKNGKSKMAALVLKSTGKPSFVLLTSPDVILSVAGKDMESTDRANKDKLYDNKELYSLVWTDRLLKSLSGIKKIYFAPDGYLHRLAIEYMPPVKDMELYRLTSSRRLMEPPTVLASSEPILLVGGVNYDLDKAPGNEAYNDASAYSNYIGKSFPRLSESSNEAKSILDFRSNVADTLISASRASENMFKTLAHNYSSILVSTHGDFCDSSPIPSDIKASEQDETMSHNIIAFAGVNSYLQDKKFDAKNHCDGLLSAKEISQLDLSNCKLFTISACQSALGHISSDGVFGLQRGLKNAGVDVMLLSLWNVNSEATSLLMRSFYRNLNNGMSIYRAFSSARNDLMIRQPEDESREVVYIFDPATMSSVPIQQSSSESFDSPQYLNAFILIDAID